MTQSDYIHMSLGETERDMSPVVMNLYDYEGNLMTTVKVIDATIRRGATSSNGMSVGASIASELVLQCTYSSWMIKGAQFYFEIQRKSDGNVLYFQEFVVDYVDKKGNIVMLTCYGNVYKLQLYPFDDGRAWTMAMNNGHYIYYDNSTQKDYRPTYRDILNTISEQTGVNFIEVYSGDSHLDEFLSDVWTDAFRNEDGIMSCRGALEVVAQALCCNVFDYYQYEEKETSVQTRMSHCCISLHSPAVHTDMYLYTHSIYKDSFLYSKQDYQKPDCLDVKTTGKLNPSIIGRKEEHEQSYGAGTGDKCKLVIDNSAIPYEYMKFRWEWLSKFPQYTYAEISMAGYGWINEHCMYSIRDLKTGAIYTNNILPMVIETYCDGGLMHTLKSITIQTRKN